MNSIKYQLLKVNVPEKNAVVKFSADSDKKYDVITGLFASIAEDAALIATTLELRIADVEVFGEDHEIKLITCGQEVSPNNRFYDKQQFEAAGSTIEGRYTDGGKATIYPYTAVIYLRLEKLEKLREDES